MEHKMSFKGSRKQTQGRIRQLVSQHSGEDPDIPNAKRERFLALLRRKYGYTNEKSIDELKRLLKQLYSMNRSVGIHRARPRYKHPPAD